MSFFGDVGHALGFDGGGTGLAGTLGLTHPDNPAAQRGTPRGGQAPDKNNYLLGGDPNWLSNFAAGTQANGAQAGQVGQQGQALTQQAQGLQGNANTLTGQANDLQGQANAAAGRTGPSTSYDPTLGAAQNRDLQGGQSQYQVGQQFQDFANRPQGPSAAQAQLRQGTDQALAAQLATARSGSGFGESATALANAGAGAASTISNDANQAAQLRASEDQNYRQQQLSALTGANDAYGAGRAGDLGLANQLAQQGQFNTGTELQQRQLNDQQQQALTNSGLQGQSLGLQAQQQSLEGQNMGIQDQNQALAQQLAAQGLDLNAAQAQQQGTMGYEQGLTDIYGIDNSAHQQTRQLDQSAGQAGVGGVLGLATSVGGALLSDRRTKKSVRPVDVAARYRRLSRQLEALGG